jgi:hypothetical protein
MFKMKWSWSVLALVAAATVATAQTHEQRLHNGGVGDAGGKIGPALGDAGRAICFGDGTEVACPARNNGLPGHGCENSLGRGGALLAARGFAKISEDTVILTVDALPRGTTVLYMQGGKAPYMPYVYGDGIMCLGGSVNRLAVKRPSDWSSTFPERGDPTLSHAGNLPRLGATVYYQAMYRDEHPFALRDHLNLSNAWSTTWVP